MFEGGFELHGPCWDNVDEVGKKYPTYVKVYAEKYPPTPTVSDNDEDDDEEEKPPASASPTGNRTQSRQEQKDAGTGVTGVETRGKKMRGTGVTGVGGCLGLPDWESNPDLQGENLIS